MADETYNDRALTEADDATLPKPQIEIIVDGPDEEEAMAAIVATLDGFLDKFD